MLIGRDKECIEIVELERVPGHLPTPGDVRVKATVTLQLFSGSHSDVWLSQPDLAAFVKQLRIVVDSRKGTAKLEAMSPDEFSLELRATDSLGHYEVSVRLCRYQYSGPTHWLTAVSGGFEFEPDQLPSILAAFQALLEPCDAS